MAVPPYALIIVLLACSPSSPAHRVNLQEALNILQDSQNFEDVKATMTFQQAEKALAEQAASEKAVQEKTAAETAAQERAAAEKAAAEKVGMAQGPPSLSDGASLTQLVQPEAPFGFKVNDVVTSPFSFPGIPEGTEGTVVGFNDTLVKVTFRNGKKGKIEPVHLFKASALVEAEEDEEFREGHGDDGEQKAKMMGPTIADMQAQADRLVGDMAKIKERVLDRGASLSHMEDTAEKTAEWSKRLFKKSTKILAAEKAAAEALKERNRIKEEKKRAEEAKKAETALIEDAIVKAKAAFKQTSDDLKNFFTLQLPPAKVILAGAGFTPDDKKDYFFVIYLSLLTVIQTSMQELQGLFATAGFAAAFDSCTEEKRLQLVFEELVKMLALNLAADGGESPWQAMENNLGPGEDPANDNSIAAYCKSFQAYKP